LSAAGPESGAKPPDTMSAEFGTQSLTVGSDSRAGWPAFAIIGRQGLVQRQVAQVPSERQCVTGRLRHAHGRMRPHDEGGVAQQRHMAGCHARRLIVEDGLDEWVVLGSHGGSERRRQKSLRFRLQFCRLQGRQLPR
jgi:hypothetical protein